MAPASQVSDKINGQTALFDLCAGHMFYIQVVVYSTTQITVETKKENASAAT